MNTLKASNRARQHLEALSYPGQDPNLRMYRSGYEQYMDQMPVLNQSDSNFRHNLCLARHTMRRIAADLKVNPWWKGLNAVPGSFKRTVLAMEAPSITVNGELASGNEIVLGHWGRNVETSVHGHEPGFIHEEMIDGKMLVNSYRIVNEAERIVRATSQVIFTAGTISSGYERPNHGAINQMVHNVKALEPSTTLHFFAGHTRDGRGNQFTVEHFEDTYGLDIKHMRPVMYYDVCHAEVGEVYLIRDFKNDRGDAYLVRLPNNEDLWIAAPHAAKILDVYSDMDYTQVFVQLKDIAASEFLHFHNITA